MGTMNGFAVGSAAVLLWAFLAAAQKSSDPGGVAYDQTHTGRTALAPAPVKVAPSKEGPTVKPLMPGYPPSRVHGKVINRSASTAPQPSALEGGDNSKPELSFNHTTKILTIRVSRPQRLSISAFVLTGKQVNRLATEKFLSAGTHQISFNNQKLGDGIVIFKIEGAGFSETRTINLAP